LPRWVVDARCRGIRRREHIWTWGVYVLIAATTIGLRFWKIEWGASSGDGFPDEWMFVERAAHFCPMTPASFDATDMLYPTAFYYLLGLVAAAACKLRLIAQPSTDRQRR
jgi:hypothetical protein